MAHWKRVLAPVSFVAVVVSAVLVFSGGGSASVPLAGAPTSSSTSSTTQPEPTTTTTIAPVPPPVVAPPPTTATTVPQPQAPPVSSPGPSGDATPGPNQQLGQQLAAGGYGWVGAQWTCLDTLWGVRESGWNQYAGNPSGAYGIPQALPGSKMGEGWHDDPRVQIEWGLGYIAGRYGDPCSALAHSYALNWY